MKRSLHCDGQLSQDPILSLKDTNTGVSKWVTCPNFIGLNTLFCRKSKLCCDYAPFFDIIFEKKALFFKFLVINVGILGDIICPTSKSHCCKCQML